MPRVIARSIAIVSVESDGSRNRNAHSRRRHPGNAEPTRARDSGSPHRNTERICAGLLLERVIEQRRLEVLQRHGALEPEVQRVASSNVAMATELSKESCSQRRSAGWGVITRSVSNQPEIVAGPRAKHHAVLAEVERAPDTGRPSNGCTVSNDISVPPRSSRPQESRRSRP